MASNRIEVQGQADIRLRIADFDTPWTVIVARGLSSGYCLFPGVQVQNLL